MTTNTQNAVHPVHIYLCDLEELACDYRMWRDFPYADDYPDELHNEPWAKTAYMLTAIDSQDRELCRKEDHDWVDEGYAGPDSGCIDMTCKRCGYSIHHTLY